MAVGMKFSGQIIAITFVTLFLAINSQQIHAQNSSIQKNDLDIRLVIDISGSMKQNDPNKLRIPALQLVTNLMPKGAESGVWAFGRYVNMLVPLGKVDQEWQEASTQAAKKISSAGLYTNIGDALVKASYGWTTPDDNEKRSIILLTDGMVDISKDPNVNKREREKIINTILPKLVKANIKIHTIALSQNADHELLKLLSVKTDGSYQSVDTAEQLQKVFLQLFEMSAQRDALPISENKFTVDASIEEMTILVFKSDSGKQTRLHSPDQKVIDRATSDTTVRWFSTEGYDLITVDKPKAGDWKIEADVDPENRVMVVSKLGLLIDDLPNNLLSGEAINYQMRLTEDGKVIARKEFLKLVEATLLQDKGEQQQRLAMFHDSSANSFKQNFFTDGTEGTLKLELSVKSPTFERVRQHSINIYGSPLTEQVEVSSTDKTPHRVIFSVREDIVQMDSLKVTATVINPLGEKQFLPLTLSEPIEISPLKEGGRYSVAFDIKGKSLSGRDFSVSPDPVKFDAPATEEYLAEQATKLESEKQNQLADELAKQTDETPPEKDDSKEKQVVEPAIEPEVKEDQTQWVYIGLGANLVLFGLGYVVWVMIKKRRKKSAESMLDELSGE